MWSPGTDTEKCGVQNSNQLFRAITHLIQYSLHSSSLRLLLHTIVHVKSLIGVSKNFIDICVSCYLFI